MCHPQVCKFCVTVCMYMVLCKVGKFKKDEAHTAAVSNLLSLIDLDAVPEDDNDDSETTPAKNMGDAAVVLTNEQGDARTSVSSPVAPAAAAAARPNEIDVKKEMECLMQRIMEMRGEVAIDVDEEPCSDDASKMGECAANNSMVDGRNEVAEQDSAWAEQNLETMEHHMLSLRRKGPIVEVKEQSPKKLRRLGGFAGLGQVDSVVGAGPHLDPELPTAPLDTTLPEPAEPSRPIVLSEPAAPVVQAVLCCYT
jgi:hypothetical protein